MLNVCVAAAAATASTPIADQTCRGILGDLPTAFQADLAGVAARLAGCRTRVGSIYTGACLFHSCTRSLVKTMGELYGCSMPELEHAFGAEIDERKRDFIMSLDDPPQHLFGDAADLDGDLAWCYVNSRLVPVPPCDWLSFGFSCKSLSSANVWSNEYDRALAAGVEGNLHAGPAGTSGETAGHALRYVKRHRPALVLIENVKGLFAGLYKRNAFTLQAEKDACSNMMVLLRELKVQGYVTPISLMDAAQRGGGRRKRAYLPCVLAGETLLMSGAVDMLPGMIENLMTELSSCPQTMPWSLSDIFCEDDEWCQRAAEAASSFDLRAGDDVVLKWMTLHRATFQAASLHYPPVYTADFVDSMRARGVAPRQAEILWYFAMVAPLDGELCFDTVLDLSQSIDRLRPQPIMPCILPGARLWWRRAGRWVTAPEAMTAQGFDLPPNIRQFPHRLVLDLVGKSFAGSSYTIALTCQIVLASHVARAQPGPVNFTLLKHS